MPINLELVNDGHLLKLDIVSPWNLNELLQMYDEAKQYFDNSTFRVDTLVDISNMKTIPAGVLRARQSPFLSHPWSGYQVVVGASPYAKSMAELLFRLTNFKRVRFFATMDDAWQFLRSAEVEQQVIEVKTVE